MILITEVNILIILKSSDEIKIISKILKIQMFDDITIGFLFRLIKSWV